MQAARVVAKPFCCLLMVAVSCRPNQTCMYDSSITYFSIDPNESQNHIHTNPPTQMIIATLSFSAERLHGVGEWTSFVNFAWRSITMMPLTNTHRKSRTGSFVACDSWKEINLSDPNQPHDFSFRMKPEKLVLRDSEGSGMSRDGVGKRQMEPRRGFLMARKWCPCVWSLLSLLQHKSLRTLIHNNSSEQKCGGLRIRDVSR